MRIAIDAVPVSDKPRAGVANYSIQLLRRVSSLDKGNKYIVFGSTLDPDEIAIDNRNFHFRRISPLFKYPSFWYYWTAWYYTGFPYELKMCKPDIFFSMQPVLPAAVNCPAGVVVYDITPLVMTSAFRQRFRWIFSAQLVSAIKRAQRIVTISEATKNDLIRRFNLDGSSIEVVYPGLDETLFHTGYDAKQIQFALGKYGIKKRYIIYVGTLEPKKNIPLLLKAYWDLASQKKIEHSLVIAGKRGWKDALIFSEINRLGLQDDVLQTGYVRTEDLPLLLNGADAFVFPSVHEGFGIPPLEAMACGTPVITSNTSSLPEVVGEAGIQINPYSVEDLSAAIFRVLSDRTMQEELRGKGLERAKLFSWNTSASKLIGILNDMGRAGI